MTKRDLFILIIRIFGLYWFVQAIAFTLPSQIGFVLQYGDAMTLVWLILVFIIMMAVLMLLLFYASWLVDKLKLLKGFDDERIEFGRINSTDLYRMGVFFIGGVFLLKHLSALLVNAGHFFKNDQAGQLISEQMKMNLIINIIAIFIALLLITNGKRIAGWISDRNN